MKIQLNMDVYLMLDIMAVKNNPQIQYNPTTLKMLDIVNRVEHVNEIEAATEALFLMALILVRTSDRKPTRIII